MSSAEQVIVKTCQGLLRGKKVPSVRRGSYFSFQGIPYGKPPVGQLRFKAPVKPEPWNGIRDALTEGSVAPSQSLLTREYIETSSEDCLYLNVYTPEIPDNGAGDLKAVLFWIHGGGFSSGSGGSDLYSADYLVADNVVVVTCNYRLGPLGFLSLQNADCPGNNGLKDVVLALKWCQENIAAFGGDPQNVTVFGESAGGAAVHFLTLTKKTEGLFQKAIAQSGVATNPWALAMKPRECAFKLGEALGCNTNDDRVLLEFLQGVKPEELVAKAKQVLKVVEPNEHFVENGFVPCVEPETEESLITKHPDEMYRCGDIRKIPFMMGANTLEGLIILKRGEPIQELKTDKEMEKLIPKNLNLEPGSQGAKEIVDMIRAFYFPNGFDEKGYVNALSRIYFLNGINQTIEHHSRFSDSSAPTFVYRFAFDGNVFCIKYFLGFKDWKGTCHGDELSYLFRQKLFDVTIPEGSKEHAMMEVLTGIWTSFAKTGTPMPESPRSWSPVGRDSFPYMDIDQVLEQKFDLEKREFEFWREVHRTATRFQSNSKL